MVYTIAVESIERRVNHEHLAAALIIALGGDAQVPSLGDAQREFDEWLMADPANEVRSPDVEWRQVMGVA